MDMEKIPEVKPLEELRGRASAILRLSDKDLRGQFILIAERETPTQAYEKALDLANEHFDARMALDFAKACRYLAIVQRDYGQANLLEITA